MVFSNSFVVCILVDGKPQKELANGTVKVPFDTEYAVRLRNKNSRRAVAHIYIDGEKVSGGGYIIPAKDHVDIKRHNDKDRAFKFVSLDSEEAVDFGKNGPNPDKVKGTIEVRVHLEKEQPKVVYRDVHHHHHHDHHHYPKPKPQPWIWPNYGLPYNTPTWTTCDSQASGYYGASGGTSMGVSGGTKGMSGGVIRSCSASFGSAGLNESPTKTCSLNNMSAPELKDGCTVEGNLTGQNFYSAWIDTEDAYTSLRIFLQGYEEEVVQTAKRKTNKDQRLDDLEQENEELRRKLAEIENEKLREQLKELGAKLPY